MPKYAKKLKINVLNDRINILREHFGQANITSSGRMDFNMTKYYIWLLQVMGHANPRTVQLLKHFGNAVTVFDEIMHGNDNFLKPSEQNNLKRTSLEKAEGVVEYCKENGYSIITIDDKDYPTLLKNIYNPPVLLFSEGDISGLDNDISLTVVGTRKACDYSFMVTQKICTPLAKIGTTIVSGMAIGVDKIAHSAAIDAGGRTIGVLAGGINIDYPSGSMGFRKQITACGGAVISELLPNTHVDKGYFNSRNRIMSGLSQGVLLIEAAMSSGCHITAKHAINQNRDLFCIPPHNIFDPRFAGVVSYLRDGAVPVFNYMDIINEYSNSYGKKYHSLSQTVKNTVFYDIEAVKIQLSSDNAANNPTDRVIPEKPPAPDFKTLGEEQKVIVDLLLDGARSVDFLLSESNYNADDISNILLELEIDGIIESAPGASFQLAGRENRK